MSEAANLPEHGSWLRRRPIAHRGLHRGAAVPENSLLAFQHAIEAGFAIEMDVRLSGDGNVYAFHDDTLGRLTGVDVPFHAADQTCLASLRLLNSDQHIPRLEEVLELVAGRVPLLVEIKTRGEVGPLESCVAALLAVYRGQFAVQSFHPFSVAWFRRHVPGMLRGQLAGDFRGAELSWPRKLALRRMWFNAVSRPHFIAYDVRCLPQPRVAQARRRGLPVLAWTVDSAGKLDAARRHADNIIFEGIRP
jgi:glycerophosphoryl diester phosphodiesterase